MVTEMTYDDWAEAFKPEQEQHDDVPAVDVHYVWTAVEGDDGREYICSGVHFVNRLFYLTTQKPWSDEQDIVVSDDDPEGANCWECDDALSVSACVYCDYCGERLCPTCATDHCSDN